MAKIRKIYDQTIKPDGSKTTIYPITSTRAVYTPDGVSLDIYLKDKFFRESNLDGYKVAENIASLPDEETNYGYFVGENLYVWVGENGDTKGGLYQNCGAFNGSITNNPDEEDITVKNEVLKLRNRANYYILRENKTFTDQVVVEDSLYEIRYNFDLNGATVTIPIGCTLKFNGGKLSNGQLVCQNTAIISEGGKCIDTNLILSGTFSSPLKLSLFGIAGNSLYNASIWKATTFPTATAYEVDSDVVFSEGDIEVPRAARIKGNGHRFTFTASSATHGLLLMSYRCFVEGLDVFCARDYEGSVVVANTPYNNVHDFRLANMTISGAYNSDNDFNAIGLEIYADNSNVVAGAITGCVIDNVRFEWLKHGIKIHGVNYNRENVNDYCWLNTLYFSNIYIISTYEGILTSFTNNGGSNTPTAVGSFFFTNVEYQARQADGQQSLLRQEGNFGYKTYIRDSICWDTPCFARVLNGQLYTQNIINPGSYANNYPDTGTDDYGNYTLKYKIIKLYNGAALFRDFSLTSAVDFLSDDYTQGSGTQKFRIASSGQKLEIARQDVSADMYLKNGNEAALSIGHARTQNNFYFANSDDSTRTQYFQWLAKNPGRTDYRILDFVRQYPVLGTPGDLVWADSYDNKEVYGLKVTTTIAVGSTAEFKAVLKFMNSEGTLVNYTTYSASAACAIDLARSFSKVWSQKMDISNVHYAIESNELVLYFTAKALEAVSGTNYVWFEAAYVKAVAAANITTTDDGFIYVNRSKTDFLQNATVTLLGTIVPSGLTSARPSYSGIPIGFMYLDTTLGKPIFVKAVSGNSITWIDATGTVV